jgi:hypothetical protein
VSIEVPKIEVRYEHLSVEGDVYVGSRALPTLFNVTLNTIDVYKYVPFSFCIFLFRFCGKFCFVLFFSKSYFKITVKQRDNFPLSSGGATFTIGGAPKIGKKKKKKLFTYEFDYFFCCCHK